MEKFHGDFTELETLVSELGYKGQWEDDNGKKIFRSEDKAVLNWWPQTGSLHAQGPAAPKIHLEEAVNKVLSGDPPAPVVSTATAPAVVVDKPSPAVASADVPEGVSERVFVVYGHDEPACEQLELVLHR